jgi:hypothetical protein
MDLTPKQQASEAIRQAESILLVTGQRPNIDQVASMVALTHALRKMDKKVTPLVTDRVPGGAQFIAKNVVETSLNGSRDFIVQVSLAKAEVDKVKYTVDEGKLNIHVTPFSGGFAPADVTFDKGDYHFDLIIALGVPRRANLDRIFEQNPGLLTSTPMLNLDYHRINEQHGAINLLETNSSTLSEMVLALTESVQGGLLDAQMATALLAGIMAATDRFTAASTTAKSMTVAAQMLAAGADQQKVTKEIFGERERKPRREEQPKAAPASAPRAEYKPVEARVEAPKPEPVVETPQPVVEAPQAPQAPQEPEVFETAPDVDQEIDDFINGSVDNDPLTWEAPAEDGVINYRP